LLRAIATALELHEVPGHQPMAQTPAAERDHLVEVRTSSCNMFVERIKMLKDVISTKDETLLSYEQSLAKLAYVCITITFTEAIVSKVLVIVVPRN
jgi:hypothetical protein